MQSVISLPDAKSCDKYISSTCYYFFDMLTVLLNCIRSFIAQMYKKENLPVQQTSVIWYIFIIAFFQATSQDKKGILLISENKKNPAVKFLELF